MLETIAGVPGMIGAMSRHFHSLRKLTRDNGWIHTLLGKHREYWPIITNKNETIDQSELEAKSRRRCQTRENGHNSFFLFFFFFFFFWGGGGCFFVLLLTD